MKAFILGAGLGTRLRPLTAKLPKPLVPLHGRPLVERTLDACWAMGVSDIAINTHHCHEMWVDEQWGITGCGGGLRAPMHPLSERETELPLRAGSVHLFHEPILLETGGGLRNIRSWWGDQPLLIHNGDVLATFPLSELLHAHRQQGCTATLALRSMGTENHVAIDANKTRVVDIRQRLGRAAGTHVFTGIYCVEADFFHELPVEPVASVLPALLRLAARGDLAAVVLDQGDWRDLGDRDSYLQAHAQELRSTSGDASDIAASARIAPSASIRRSFIGAGATVEAGAVIEDSVLWPGSHVAAHARLRRCIICSQQVIHGQWTDRDG